MSYKNILTYCLLMLPIASHADLMSYVINGEVTTIGSSSIISDTNIAEPASIRGTIVYDTNERGSDSFSGSRYSLVSLNLIIESQTDVTLNVVTNNSYITYFSFGQPTSIPSVDTASSDDIQIKWSGSGLGSNTTDYSPKSIKIILPSQVGVLLPQEEIELSASLSTNAIQLYLEDATIYANITSLKVVSGNQIDSSSGSSSSTGGGGAMDLRYLIFILSLIIGSIFIRRLSLKKA